MIDPKGKYINILNPIKPSTDTTLYPELLTDNDFYNNLTQEGKALLLLSTFPFTKFTNVLDVIKDKTQAQVLSLPTLYLYYIGGLLARLKNDFLSGWNTLSTPKEPVSYTHLTLPTIYSV